MKNLIFFSNILWVLFISLNSFAQDGKFTFTIPSTTTTSAGVFKDDSILIRTLWNNVDYPAGTYTKSWDGKNDYGVSIIDNTIPYSVKIMSSNVNYQWQGVLGNTSKMQTGSGVHRGYYHCMLGLVITNGYGYYCRGYAEGAPSLAKFAINDPQTKIDFVNSPQPGDINYVATDDINVYWGAYDANANTNSFVFGSRVADDTDVSFSKGKSYSVTYGKTYAKAISVVNQANSHISGLAVQKTGNYLFVARSGLNQLQVLNKTTGELIKTLTFTAPKSLCVDKTDKLWMVTGVNTLAKYTVDTGGSLSAAILNIAGILQPAAIQVSPDGTLLTVADDSTSQQVKFYNNTTGALSYTLGIPGGYLTDPTVSDNKFYFNDLRSDEINFLAYQPDGSFWVGDPGNYRAQHYSSGRVFIDRIQSLGATYNTGVDKNNINRVFSDNLEFEVDYAVQSLSGSAGWKLIRNWGANIPATPYLKTPKYQTTLSNGRTYGLLLNGYNWEVVEYPVNGPMRFTGTKLMESTKILCDDGSIQDCTLSSSSCVLKRFPLLGFDALNNPQWSTVPEILASSNMPSTGGPGGFPRTQVLTSSNKVVFYNHKVYANNIGPVYSSGYHLGVMSRGGRDWLFQTEKSTYRNYTGDFPAPGYFDVGNLVNDYGGGNVNVFERNIITSYHGEFWKNGQTNMFNHYWDNGLSVGQFGVTRSQTTGESPAMMAGNVLSPIIVKSGNGDYYLYHGDESDHAGLHRWKITGLNSISEQIIPLAPPTTYAGGVGYIDLMKDLPFDAIMPNNVGGWTRNPTTNSVVDKFSNAFTAFTGRLKIDQTGSPDILLNFVKTTAQNYSISRDLGTNNINYSWKISGELAYLFNMPNGNSIAQYFDILDANGKILTRFYPELNRSVSPFIATIYGNKVAITQGYEYAIRDAMRELHPWEVKIVDGAVSFTYDNYAPVTTTIYDPTANWKTPKTLRVVFTSTNTSLAVYQTIIDLKDLKFYKDYLTLPGVNIPPVVNAGNDKLVTLPVANNTTLNGSATDAGGSISSYAWTKISGPTGGNIGTPSSATTNITGLTEGVHRYQLKATDNQGAISIDTAQVTVLRLNEAPVANAGTDKSIVFPTLSTVLSGTGTDPDGTIVSYLWTKISGSTNFLIALPTSASTLLSALVPGSYEFELTVTDDKGAIAKDTIKISVNLSTTNKSPVAVAGADKSMTLPTNSTTLYGTASDPDGTILGYSWSKVSGPTLGVIASPGAATTIIYNLAMGIYLFELTVTDNGYAVKKDTVKITVNRGTLNQIPVVNAGPDKSVISPTNTAIVSGSGSDLEGPVTFLWSKLSGPSSYYMGTPNLSGTTLSNLVMGVYVFQLKVTDDSGVFVTDNVTVTVYTSNGQLVTPVYNEVPISNAGADKVITLPANNVSLAGSGIDIDGSIVSYSWTKVSGPGTYTIASPASGATTINNLVQGTYQFQLTVSDNDGTTASDFVQVSVDAGSGLINQPPAANAGSDKAITLPTNIISLTGSGTDADGTITAYTWSKISGPATFTIVSPSSATTSISNLVQGTYQFQLTVTDNDGATDSDIVQVIVNSGVNLPPSANAGTNKVITLPTNSVSLTGGGTDTDGTITGYSWSKISGPATFTIASPSSATTTINNLVQGTYQFKLTITDNDGATDSDTMQVTVNSTVNLPPSANAGSDKTITLPTNSVSLAGSGADSDGTVTAYSWVKISGPATFIIVSPSSATTTISNLAQGTYQFQLTVTDNDGATTTDNVQVIVNSTSLINQPPVANAGADKVVLLPTSSTTITGTGTDADGTVASYQWRKYSGPGVNAITSANTPTATISSLVQGNYFYIFTVTDDDGGVSTDTMKVIVNSTSSNRPVVNPVVSPVIIPVGGNGNTTDTIKPTVSVPDSVINLTVSVPKSPTSIYDINRVKVYPNPVKDIANINITSIHQRSKISVSLINSSGIMVKYKEITTVNNDTVFPLNMSGLNNGVYFIKIIFDDGKFTTVKVIKY